MIHALEKKKSNFQLTLETDQQRDATNAMHGQLDTMHRVCDDFPSLI
jgi:hypothetical protein